MFNSGGPAHATAAISRTDICRVCPSSPRASHMTWLLRRVFLPPQQSVIRHPCCWRDLTAYLVVGRSSRQRRGVLRQRAATRRRQHVRHAACKSITARAVAATELRREHVVVLQAVEVFTVRSSSMMPAKRCWSVTTKIFGKAARTMMPTLHQCVSLSTIMWPGAGGTCTRTSPHCTALSAAAHTAAHATFAAGRCCQGITFFAAL